MTEILQTPKLVIVLAAQALSAGMSCGRWPSAAIASGSPAGGPISPAICSRSAMSARSSRCRPICACAGRSTAPCRAPTMSSISSASCIESGRQKFSTVHEFGARAVAEAARAVGAGLTHVSALGADLKSASVYARTKARGEKAVLETHQGRRDLPAVDRFRPGGPVLQPLRQYGALFAGAAADRRRRRPSSSRSMSATSPKRSPARSTARSRAARSTSLAARMC